MKVNFKLDLVIDGWGTSCDIALRWMSLGLTDDKSTMVQLMAWCHQATSHYLSQCWSRSMSPYGHNEYKLQGNSPWQVMWCNQKNIIYLLQRYLKNWLQPVLWMRVSSSLQVGYHLNCILHKKVRPQFSYFSDVMSVLEGYNTWPKVKKFTTSSLCVTHWQMLAYHKTSVRCLRIIIWNKIYTFMTTVNITIF